MSFRAPWVSLPGTDTTMFDPSVLTSALPTPKPLIRFSRIVLVVAMSLLLILAPSSATGVRVTVVPPRRSRPSAGE